MFKILYKDEQLCITLKIVGVFDFPILIFELGNCPPAWGFSNVEVHSNGGLRI